MTHNMLSRKQTCEQSSKQEIGLRERHNLDNMRFMHATQIFLQTTAGDDVM